MIHIVKRKGHKEEFDERKVYASSYSACLSIHLKEEESEKIAAKVTQKVKDFLKNKDEVTSGEIFDLVKDALKKYNEHAAFMYETHRDIS